MAKIGKTLMAWGLLSLTSLAMDVGGEEGGDCWNQLPTELRSTVLRFLPDHSLLSLRQTSMDFGPLVDREFEDRSLIKNPIACLQDHSYPQTLSYIARQTLERIPSILSDDRDRERTLTWLESRQQLFRCWNFLGEEVISIVKDGMQGGLSSSIICQNLVGFTRYLANRSSLDASELILYSFLNFAPPALTQKEEFSLFCEEAQALIGQNKQGIAFIYLNAAGSLMFQRGKLEIAQQYYEIAASNSNGSAQSSLGVIYTLKGDHKKAVSCFQLAASQGSQEAQNNLGIYYKSIGDLELSNMYFQMARLQGSRVTHRLGLFCNAEGELSEDLFKNDVRDAITVAEGFLGDEEKNSTGLKMYLQGSANQGNASAQYDLTKIFAKESLHKKTLGDVLDLYHKAANQGHAPALFELGMLFLRCDGNIDSAKIFMQEAIKKDYPLALHCLGVILHNEGDLNTSKDCFEKAAEKGVQQAKEILKLIG